MNHCNLARNFFASLVLLMAAGSAGAGTIDKGAWSPGVCGTRPEAPQLDLRNPDAYNKSIEGVNAYRLSIRTYLECLTNEANGDIQTITKSASDAQRAAREANEAILADVKAADKKFGQ